MAEFFTGYSNAMPRQMSLAEMMNLASGVQQYQQAQQMNPLTLRKAAAETRVSEETAPTRIAEQQAQTETAQTAANSAKLENARKHLDNVKRESVKLLQEDKLTRNDVIDHYKKTIGNMGGDEKAVNQAIERIPQTNDTNQLKTWIARDFTGALSAESQIERLFPTAQMVGTGAETRPTFGGSALSFNVPGEKAGPSFANQLPLGQREEVSGTDIYGNPLVNVKNEKGAVVGQKGVPVIGQNAPVPMPMRFRPGESAETVKAMQTERLMAKDSAAAAAPALMNIQTVRKYLPLAATGANSEAISKMQSIVGNIAGSKPEEMAAAARDIIEKSIADLALQKNQALGGKFVEDLKGAAQSLASAGRNPTAIAKSMDQLEPLIQHAQYYQQGLENAIAKNKGDVQVKRDFDNAMIKAYDPQALGAYNAFKSGGEPALNQYLMDLSPDKKKAVSPGQKANIFMKIQKYVNLVNGDL
jgi:hypothetical protein